MKHKKSKKHKNKKGNTAFKFKVSNGKAKVKKFETNLKNIIFD